MTTKNRFTKFILKIIKRFLQKSITFCTLLWIDTRDMWTMSISSLSHPPNITVTTKQSVHNNYMGGIFHLTTNNEQKVNSLTLLLFQNFNVSFCTPFPHPHPVCKELKHYIWWTAKISLHLKCRTPMKQRNVGFLNRSR